MTNQQPKPLPCGCIRGYFLCREAEALWKQATSLYHAPFMSDEYNRIMAEYNQHFITQDKLAENPTPPPPRLGA